MANAKAKDRAKSAYNADIYKVTWTGKYGNSGEIVLFSQRQVDSWLRSMRSALLTYKVEKIFLR